MGRSDFFFAKPSFLEGMSRVLDLGGTLQEYNDSPTPEAADAWALYNDFKAVGKDIESAMKSVEDEKVSVG